MNLRARSTRKDAQRAQPAASPNQPRESISVAVSAMRQEICRHENSNAVCKMVESQESYCKLGKITHVEGAARWTNAMPTVAGRVAAKA